MTATPSVAKTPTKKQAGIAYWMQRVLEECDHASVDFSADPVHDLRVALRRCRSMADGLMAMDPRPGWKRMKKAGKQLFSSLGELRDVQVMEEWVQQLVAADDAVTLTLHQYLGNRESHLKHAAAQALRDFDRKQWTEWSVSLPRSAARMRPGNLIFRHLALERWTDAYELHRRALRSRSQIAWHSLRIGIKRFRYIVENFLPQLHEASSDDLKHLQDLLGEVHDLDVLWATALQIRAFPDDAARSLWHARIAHERNRRIQDYRTKMVGKSSLWHVWRAELPNGKQVEDAALRRLTLWASFLDPDFKHSLHVSRLADQLYAGLPANHVTESTTKDERDILRLAALLHEVGRSKKEKNHHKRTFKLIQNLRPPLGWSALKLHLVAVVARYHRGTLPRAGQSALNGLTPEDRNRVLRLAGILRLANTLDFAHDGRIRRLKVEERNGCFQIAAEGYSPRERLAEHIAGARHLLETVYRRPVMVKRLAIRQRLSKNLPKRIAA